jgi:D-glycero-D-manno-heptose 1,7-bisphosphate phosphatase
MLRAVFLDRDGVLNRAVLRGGISTPPHNTDELEILPGVLDACKRLRAAGFLLIVVTNQPDVSRRAIGIEAVEEINQNLRAQLPLDDVRVCYHDNDDHCTCRKPAPGLLLEAASDWKIDLRASFMVGDRGKDIEAGRRAGCRTILIENSQGSKQESSPDHFANSFPEATSWILNQPHRESREDR